ncbi:bifunctional diaminohydroxyphosphoribosylaminopyrimidine deaminase/5-amino-6-(5-phosphoribosylamino)uracil reductase RibD [Pseudoroseomonas cervicalis]|uniref:bifunctional diaminohydroxyphosphoribosylaminopyrimidine deaminase/5-amino-6-(5-phosphoribosylamino)uracil reductase RibD n=2 Tax=Teichococcus cervicalis TaxID=204525 RepID=UPI0022F1D724|nr:bifunctional diaminohydroxyphosphoribosylaminopyrimidine deaminase/5-amino-6-(5-phosphoribosylamino)uracil reductase RibD [Pseudoroseomonas cervicalis]WBV44658.1 bifunctional diaminohydroxyphosphoribosylaminopyrimidine deaminase/5-amino-6-(5-phosphoribosylamino)uracil reductase RibD [Pseudoroseomonas cervicalis]
MRAALALAARGLGNVWPNPSVGCVLVSPQGQVVGRGWTAPGGRPHAETEALKRAGAAARGATAYVTLEPCCHWGRTPPCTDALIAAGVARVVVAMRDPDPRVDGGGIEQLRAAGIDVSTGLLEDEARAINAGFTKRLTRNLPLLTLKLASTLDGRIATRSGESQWITGAPARRLAHALRGTHDAVLVGSGTALADDPELSCRIPGFAPVPTVRVVADARLRLSPGARMLREGGGPVWIATRTGHPDALLAPLRAAGAEIVEVPEAEGPAGQPMGLDPAALLRALAARGLTRVLAEGGAALAAGLLRAGLVDRLAWFHAPAIIGGDGRPALDALPLELLSAMPRYRRTALALPGADLFSEYETASEMGTA